MPGVQFWPAGSGKFTAAADTRALTRGRPAFALFVLAFVTGRGRYLVG
jgi:hypothetical protein